MVPVSFAAKGFSRPRSAAATPVGEQTSGYTWRQTAGGSRRAARRYGAYRGVAGRGHVWHAILDPVTIGVPGGDSARSPLPRGGGAFQEVGAVGSARAIYEGPPRPVILRHDDSATGHGRDCAGHSSR